MKTEGEKPTALSYFQHYKANYPRMLKICKYIAMAPTSTLPLERFFSTLSFILKPHQARLKEETIFNMLNAKSYDEIMNLSL